MRVDTIPASDIASDARRLTATFYVPEDYRTANALRAAQDRHSELLVSLCKPGGVFSGPMFRRVLVDDPRFGLPYVTATDLEQAELRPAALISRKHGVLIERLTLRAGMITVSRSGMNLGKAFSVRSDMEGFVASDDLIRLVPDSNRIAPGYLFAFLDSRHGRMAIRRSLYGGSVRHIEPKHMKDLKVPRLPAEVENEANALALGAAEDLAEHTRLLESATADLLSERDLEEPNDGTWHTDESRLGWAERTVSADSLRALNYDPRARRLQDQLKSGRYDELITLCDPRWFKGFKVFTRVDASPEHGYMLVGQRAAFRTRPEGRWISRRSVDGLGLRVKPGTILIPSHGTLGERELYCRALIVSPRTSQYVFSGDFFRCAPLPGRIRPGFLYAFLRSRTAFRLLRSISIGSKQQAFHPELLQQLSVPRLQKQRESAIADKVDRAVLLYDRALDCGDQARELVERSLDSGI